MATERRGGKALRAGALLLLLSLLATGAEAWGEDGHRIVADVAQSLLTSTAAAAVDALLPDGYILADIAPWPDAYDNSEFGGWSSPLHFVNMPIDGTTFDWKYCPPQVGCVVAAVTNYTLLVNAEYLEGNSRFCHDFGYENATDGAPLPEPCPLSFLTHFVGDIHQPLHVGYGVDVGGNSFAVEWYGEMTNLHKVWDDMMIWKMEDDFDIGWQGIAAEVLSYLQDNPDALAKYQEDVNSITWADESFSHARTSCYNFNPGTTSPTAADLGITSTTRWIASVTGVLQLNDPYYTRNVGLVLRQLAAAGARLAQRLNQIYV